VGVGLRDAARRWRTASVVCVGIVVRVGIAGHRPPVPLPLIVFELVPVFEMIQD